MQPVVQAEGVRLVYTHAPAAATKIVQAGLGIWSGSEHWQTAVRERLSDELAERTGDSVHRAGDRDSGTRL